MGIQAVKLSHELVFILIINDLQKKEKERKKRKKKEEEGGRKEKQLHPQINHRVIVIKLVLEAYNPYPNL